MYQNLQQTKGLVQGVFDKVFDKYDLMNDLMSFGIHRFWKSELIRMMKPNKDQNLVDVAVWNWRYRGNFIPKQQIIRVKFYQ